MIVHASRRHGEERLRHHLQRLFALLGSVVSQQIIQNHRPRKFWRASESSPARIEHTPELPKRRPEQLAIRLQRRLRRFRNRLKLLRHICAGSFYTLTLLPPRASQVLQQFTKTWPPIPR